MIGETWTLVLSDGGAVVGEIYVDDHDFPWYFGRFTAHDGFASLRPLFDAEADLSERLFDTADASDEASVDEGLNAAWEAAYQRIRQLVLLVRPDGSPVAEFLLHIEDDQAGFRYADEPFDD